MRQRLVSTFCEIRRRESLIRYKNIKYFLYNVQYIGYVRQSLSSSGELEDVRCGGQKASVCVVFVLPIFKRCISYMLVIDSRENNRLQYGVHRL